MRKSGKWWVIIVLILLALGWWWFRGRNEARRTARRDDASLIRDRTWVDSKPTRHTDYVNGFIALGYMPLGFVTRASSFELHVERFEHSGRDGTLRVSFPQSGRAADIGYRVTECNDLPPFDLCLDLDSNPWGGPTRYYGLRSADAEEQHLGSLRRRLLAEVPE
jgi:hypothetical protein